MNLPDPSEVASSSARKKCIWFFAALVAAVPLLIDRSDRAAAEEPKIDKDLTELLQRLEAQEATVRSISWKFESTHHRAKNPKALDPELLGLEKPEEFFTRGEVTIEIDQGYFSARAESVKRWFDGAAPAIASRGGWSYDGKTYRWWERTRHGTELPSLEAPTDRQLGPLQGTIDREPEQKSLINDVWVPQDWLDIHASESGQAFLPTLVTMFDGEPPVRLSKLLRRKSHSIRVERMPGDQWKVELTEATLNSAKGTDTPAIDRAPYHPVRLTIDPAYGVVGAEWGPPSHVWRRLFVELDRSEKGHPVPKRVLWVNTIDGDAHQVVLSEVKINPDLERNVYQAAFPAGTEVNNRLGGIIDLNPLPSKERPAKQANPLNLPDSD